jgi:predicted NAD-dependent protein-ADP-ribosyltransferase YbiA (DUF1768 family)
MECHDGKKMTTAPVHVGSGQRDPYYKLSNFHQCRVVFEGVTYPSSEHAFQAQRVPPWLRYLFSTEGPYADLDAGFKKFFADPKKAEKKAAYWRKKGNVGILAKMAINRMKDLVDMTAERCAEVFFDILVAKYTQNEHLARVLLSTGDRYILEFDRGAGRAKRAGRTCRWGGIVEDGRVVGSNQMGALLMRVRDRLLGKSA